LSHSAKPATSPATQRQVWTIAGFGIMFDDLVAAGCTLLAIAVWRFFI